MKDYRSMSVEDSIAAHAEDEGLEAYRVEYEEKLYEEAEKEAQEMLDKISGQLYSVFDSSLADALLDVMKGLVIDHILTEKKEAEDH